MMCWSQDLAQLLHKVADHAGFGQKAGHAAVSYQHLIACLHKTAELGKDIAGLAALLAAAHIRHDAVGLSNIFTHISSQW